MAIPRFFIRNYFSFFLVILRFSVPVSDKDIFLITTMSLTLERRKETALLRGSNLSYNEGVIGLTGHCLSFHARTGKL